MNLQKSFDKILAATVLPLIPAWISPNQVSTLRILSLPFIYYFLSHENYFWGLVWFALAALTDALDGAMARTRHQITDLGKLLDAAADKGLIFLVAVILIPQHFGWNLLGLMIALELLNGIAAYRAKLVIGTNPNANWAGKTKMVIQSVAFTLVFAGLFTKNIQYLNFAEGLLYASLLFNFWQSFLYPTRKLQSS